MLAEQVCDLLAELRKRVLTRADLDPSTLGNIVFHTLNQLFIEFVKDDDMKMADLHRKSAAQTMCFAVMMRP